jgi:hypothetical protein
MQKYPQARNGGVSAPTITLSLSAHGTPHSHPDDCRDRNCAPPGHQPGSRCVGTICVPARFPCLHEFHLHEADDLRAGAQNGFDDLAAVHFFEGFVPLFQWPDAANDRLHIELATGE